MEGLFGVSVFRKVIKLVCVEVVVMGCSMVVLGMNLVGVVRYLLRVVVF